MAAPHPHTGPVGPDTLITVKVIIDSTNRRFKLALRDLGANVLPQKLRFLLAIPPEVEVRFDRFSDSAGTYVTLDSNNPAIYKQLYRAAKAKLKLRLKATFIRPARMDAPAVNIMDEQSPKSELDDVAAIPAQSGNRPSYLDTVLSPSSVTSGPAPSFKTFQDARSPLHVSCAVPGAFYSPPMSTDSFVNAARQSRATDLSRPTLPTYHDFSAGTFSIDCNRCGKSIPNEHYHCSICEKGDFDLCQSCIDAGVTCGQEDHWLIKRFIRNGIVIPSITETLGPRQSKSQDTMSPSYKEESSTPARPEVDEGERTCNCCISQLAAVEFVTCNDCPDFDLCFPCFESGEHGHHPSHAFQPVDTRADAVEPSIKNLCTPGRGVRHEAICDGCEKEIFGVRHKCLSCPDWDFCSTCVRSSSDRHPGHRFAACYEPLPLMSSRHEVHRGIYCDGPQCAARPYKTYIKGDRYKCAVCHDTDFCSNCEALPNNGHNRSHPLIKIKTPIRHVSISTINQLDNDQSITQLGDRPQAKHAATETVRAASTNAATQVQTMAEVKPVEEPVPVVSDAPGRCSAENVVVPSNALEAWYEFDSTQDGSVFAPNHHLSQSWTVRNPGPNTWPAGCAVYYIGGDDMRNLDALHPSSVSTMTTANQSNVLEHSLEPGMTAVFTVLLRSPSREGRAISYWRLKTPEGLPFGHKLWVDIEVRSNSLALRPAVPIQSVSDFESVPKMESETTSVQSSTMIFPKLDKESPVSSVHDVSQAPSVVVEPTTKTEEQELLEDVESLELEDDQTDEEGFLTDEEYDILDASDEDFFNRSSAGCAEEVTVTDGQWQGSTEVILSRGQAHRS